MAKINKLSPQKAVRKKLEFKQLPLSGKTIYLDIKDARQRRKLEENLKQLGAQVEKFLSKEINYVISSNTTTTLANNKKDGQNDRPDSPSFISTPSPFNCPGGSPNSLENNKHKTQTRAQAMVKLAQSQTQTTPVLQNAERFGIKVIPVEAALKWVDKESSKLQSSVSNPGKSQPNRRSGSEIRVKKLLAPWVKFEAANRHYRPIYSELGSFPYCNVDTPAGTCPFDGSSVSKAQRTEPEFRDKVVASPVDGQGKDRDTPRNSLNSKGQTNNDSTSKMFGMPILTAGDLKRRKERKRSVEKKSGYCECCTLRYDDIDKHLRGEDHRTFARNKDNYSQLDEIIKTLNSPALFLRKILHEHCQRKVQHKKQSKMVEEKAVERKGESEEIKKPVDTVVEGEVVKRCDVRNENNLRRRVGGSRRFPTNLNSAKNFVDNDKTTAANIQCKDKNAIISPCSVVVKSLNSWINQPQESSKETHSLGTVKQKLVIKNMAIGSLQVASTSPDKIVREEKKSTKNADSENSKDSYFSSERDVSSSSEENEVVFKNSDLAKIPQKDKTVPKKKVSPIVCRQLRSRSVKKDCNFYINRVKSAKKQLTRKSQKNKDLKNVKLLKSQPIKNNKKKVIRPKRSVLKKKQSGQTEASQSHDKIVVPSNSGPTVAKLPYNNSDLSFAKPTGRKSRNSMEVQFHDMMILNSLSDVSNRRKKSPENKTCTVTLDRIVTGNHSPVKLSSNKVTESPNKANVIHCEVQCSHPNSSESRPPIKDNSQSSKSNRSEKQEVPINSRTRSQVNLESKDNCELENDSNCAEVSVSQSEHCRTNNESEKTQPIACPTKQTTEVQCGKKIELLSRRKRDGSPNSCNILLKELTVTLEPIDSVMCPSPIFSPKSVKSQQLSPEKQIVLPDNPMPSPVFDKSPAFQASGKNSSVGSARKTINVTPAKTLSESKDGNFSTPRSGYSSTPRRRVKRQRRQQNLTCASQFPSGFISCARPESSLPSECRNTRRSLETELAEVQKSSPSFSVKNQTGKTSSTQRHYQVSGKIEEPVTNLDRVIEECPTPQPSGYWPQVSGRIEEPVTNLDRMIEECAMISGKIEESVKKLEPVAEQPITNREPVVEECPTPQTCRSLSSICHDPDSVSHSTTAQKSPNLLNIIDDSFANSSKKRVRLSQNWKVLSDRSLNKLLASEGDHAPFLGFEEKDTQSCTLSDLSFEEQSEIVIDDSDSHEWVIRSSASGGSDFDHLLPETYSSPSKGSNSSWFDACESFLVSCSTPTTSTCGKLSEKAHRKHSKKTKTPCGMNLCETGANPEAHQIPRVQCVEEPHFSLSGEVRELRSPQRKCTRNEDPDEQTVDEDIVFNFNSPQKKKRKFSNIQIQSPNSDSNVSSPPAKRYKLLKNVSDVKAKFNMNYFRKENRGGKSPNQHVKKLKKDIRLHKLNKAHAEVVIVPPKSSVVRR